MGAHVYMACMHGEYLIIARPAIKGTDQMHRNIVLCIMFAALIIYDEQECL